MPEKQDGIVTQVLGQFDSPSCRSFPNCSKRVAGPSSRLPICFPKMRFGRSPDRALSQGGQGRVVRRSRGGQDGDHHGIDPPHFGHLPGVLGIGERNREGNELWLEMQRLDILPKAVLVERNTGGTPESRPDRSEQSARLGTVSGAEDRIKRQIEELMREYQHQEQITEELIFLTSR